MISRNASTALALTTALASLAAPAFAQTSAIDDAYYQSGPWKVTELAGLFCELRHSGDEIGKLRLSKSSTQSAFFGFSLNEQKQGNTASHNVEWLFDDLAVPGRLLSGRHYQVRKSTPDIEAAFRRAHTLTIKHDGETMAEVDLKGSAVAFRELKACADQFPNSAVPMIPPPAPPPSFNRRVPAPNLDGPLPPNRDVTPIKPSAWIIESDWQRLPQLPYEVPRVVGFTVDVNKYGRVTRCMVDESSGVGQIDTITCDLITRRARFEPQTDAEGKAVPAQFSTKVRWQLPD